MPTQWSCCCLVRFVVLAAVLASAAPLATARASEEGPPDLQGVWVLVEGQVIYWTDEINTFPDSHKVAEIDIFGQEGAVFRARQVTVPASGAQAGRHGSEPIVADGVPLLGTIGYDNTTVLLADIDDTSVLLCTLVDPDTMNCMLHEAGAHALAGSMVLSRSAP